MHWCWDLHLVTNRQRTTPALVSPVRSVEADRIIRVAPALKLNSFLYYVLETKKVEYEELLAHLNQTDREHERSSTSASMQNKNLGLLQCLHVWSFIQVPLWVLTRDAAAPLNICVICRFSLFSYILERKQKLRKGENDQNGSESQ